MSSTNRGVARKKNDFYATPAWLTKEIMPIVIGRLPRMGAQRVLEPACGDGAIVNVLNSALAAGSTCDACDIDPKMEGADVRDFLAVEPSPVYDLVITNPPFSLAEEFCRHAMKFTKSGGMVVMLLRLNFLGSQKRSSWLRDNTPSVYVTPRRPSFTGGGNDSTEYAWLIWEKFRRPMVQILELEARL